MYQNLESLLSNIFPKQNLWQQQLFKDWAHIMSGLSTHMRGECIRQKTLFVGVYDYLWMHELHCLSPHIIATIKKHVPDADITGIRFRYIGREQQKKKEIRGLVVAENESSLLQKMSDKEAQTLAKVEDVELKAALECFLHKCVHQK